MIISVITPSYNREKLLINAYNSLLKQSNKSFEWIIVDDGSKDNTGILVTNLINDKKINIKYIKKENGGKHTALNKGIDEASGELIIILDSDDFLTDDAIETILDDWRLYENNEKICGISYQRKLINGPKSKSLPQSPYISNHIECRYNQEFYADRAEVYRTDVMQRFKFPVFEKERFLSETIVWNKIAMEYDMVYIDKEIYVCEYQNDGLTANSQKTRVNNPIGAMENYRIMMKKPFKFKLRIKYSILYNTFSKFANIPFLKSLDKENKLLLILTRPIGDIVYMKYKKYK